MYRGIYLNRTSLANWIIKGAAWFEPVIRQLKYHAFLEPVLNADETPTRVLKKNGESINKKGTDVGDMYRCICIKKNSTVLIP
ncbi:MAG: transposase [Ruminococcus sp.]|nr:transposase [Ruminococcus sp.]